MAKRLLMQEIVDSSNEKEVGLKLLTYDLLINESVKRVREANLTTAQYENFLDRGDK